MLMIKVPTKELLEFLKKKENRERIKKASETGGTLSVILLNLIKKML